MTSRNPFRGFGRALRHVFGNEETRRAEADATQSKIDSMDAALELRSASGHLKAVAEAMISARSPAGEGETFEGAMRRLAGACGDDHK